MKGFRFARDISVAIGFLTRLPVPAAGHAPQALARAAWCFPLTGVLVGGMGASVLYGFAFMGWSPALGVILAMALMTLFTGALHEDGLADVADGFGGGATKDRKLDIMRDSRIGSYGVLALIFGVALRGVALFELHVINLGPATILSAAVFSRTVMPWMMYAVPRAREDGLSTMAGRPGGLAVLLSFLLGAGLAIAIFGGALPLVVSAMMASVAVMVVMALLARAQIGGQTGDVLGATQQVAEIAFLITVLLTALITAGHLS